MKIVQINAVYGVGSTGHIVQDIHFNLKKKGYDSYVYWATGCSLPDSNQNIRRIGNTHDHKLHALFRRIDNKQGWHSKFATKQLCAELRKLNPDVVHLHNLHSNFINLPMLLDFLGEKDIATVITLHDCWFFTGYCSSYYYYYQNGDHCEQWRNTCRDCPAVSKYRRMSVQQMFDCRKKLFSKIQRLGIAGVSNWTIEAAKESSILKNATEYRVIYNWIDTSKCIPNKKKEDILIQYDIPLDRKILLGVAQEWSEQKGLKEFLGICDAFPDNVFVVLVGKNNGVPNRKNLRCVGYIENQQELINLYSATDIFVNPSKAETFGLVTIEALACGTPVLAYDNTGSHEIVDSFCGMLAADGQANDFINCLGQMIQINKEDFSSYCVHRVKTMFEKEKQISKYIELYQDLVNMKNERK